ncbi:hypothetical protein [Scytonema sp. UIC 10036]|uniref:hypothetical protein n=1 Tax=Scytonema sp. UIC 10036 TaxID=2304196 RepID=UPI001FAAAAEB|nr:hypothetical protein [Scytonema sp. UIC 10036]
MDNANPATAVFYTIILTDRIEIIVRVLKHITNALNTTMSEFLRAVEESLSVDRQ